MTTAVTRAVFTVILVVLPFAVAARVGAPAASPAESPTSNKNLVTFVFGDSLTDVGNNNYLPYALAKCNFPWYGVDYIGGKATGRFTNGRTIGDIISAKLGISPPPPYLSLSTNDNALLKGVNYASGGAGILNETGLYFIQRMTFNDQIGQFGNTTIAIKAKIGEQQTTKLLKKALYFIGMGSNDYVNNYLQPFMTDSQKYTPEQFLGLLMYTLENQLTKLYDYGARRVVFHGLGPLGCIPSQRSKSKQGTCLENVNQYSQQFNSRVKSLLNKLNGNLPGSRFTFADTYQDVLDLITNPQTYGFKVSTQPCCNVNTSIGGLCLPNSNLCSDRNDYVFFDAFHPTEAANLLLANKLFATLFPSG
ncbi:hypothetical protein V2J09_020546 [Rumex salicifolius]